MTDTKTLHMSIEESLGAAIARSNNISDEKISLMEPGLAWLTCVFLVAMCAGGLGAGFAHLTPLFP
ncbi:hypothetical protein [Pseudosulfitobacter pseudonitzschiae]|uniref:hypothetical protein n=1 Tax=Pseudosulfitobacter pseudonitzschiae TaxID=1402135 RepID=UPI003B829553